MFSRKVHRMQSEDVVRKHIVFRGSVQGVGFRYRARHAADAHGCTGWVKNEWDYSVSMEIQGQEEQIDRVINSIEQGRYVVIDNMECTTIPSVPGDRGFRIR